MNINSAIKIMKKEVTNPMAQTYLNSISDAIDQGGTEGLCVQLLYILENSKTWRGDVAKDTKKFIRDWIKNKHKDTNG